MTAADQLAAEVKAWRGKVPARIAAEHLGVPKRTLQNVEAGRGFPYPLLLRIAMRTIRIEEQPRGERNDRHHQSRS